MNYPVHSDVAGDYDKVMDCHAYSSIARTFGTVAELYTRLKREAAKVGLVVNASKTKYMLVGGTEHDRIRLGSSVTIDGDTIEVVEEFVYLGSLLTGDNNVSREIRRRIISGSRAYYGL